MLYQVPMINPLKSNLCLETILITGLSLRELAVNHGLEFLILNLAFYNDLHKLLLYIRVCIVFTKSI
jgi:hypothetical protein